MLTIYNLNTNQMLEKPNFFELTKGYKKFSGVSFVGSFNIIEKNLLPNFEQINLILGLEDQKTGNNLNQFFNVSQKVKELSKVSDNFIERISNKSLNLRFTKDKLFHSKYFIIENDNEFIVFSGSMNLTKKALTENHEMLWMFSGNKDDPNNNSIYKKHLELFKHNFEEDSSDYINRKIIDQIKGKDKKEITALITEDLLDAIDKDIKVVNQKDIIQITTLETPKDSEGYELLPEATTQIIKSLYTKKGNKKRNTEKIQENIKKIVFQSFNKIDDDSLNETDLYASPLWSFGDKKILTKNNDDKLAYALKPSTLLSKNDIENFGYIVKSFKYNKVRDESQQAMSAFIYLMTAPLIWKIREIYRNSNFTKSADQIPLSMVLIGRGTTGKTLLVGDYFKRFVGDKSKSLQYSEINGGNSPRVERAVRFLDNYLHSKCFISPMIIDELNSNFLHSKVATNAIKQWSNTLSGIHNVNIFAMNHNAGSREINNLEEITKRVYYLSFEAPWLPVKDQKYDFNTLINNTSEHLYKTVVYRLNERLNNLSGEDEQKLIDDYLSLTKEIILNIFTEYGYADEVTQLLYENYNYKIDRNKITWKMLIRDDDFKHISFTEGDSKTFTVSKAIFNNLKGSTYENINQTLDNYFNMFPREEGVALDQYENGMLLNIESFDHFIGEPLIRNYYNKVHQHETQQDNMANYLKSQEKQNEIMQKMMNQLIQNEETKKQEKSKSNIFKKIFGK